MDSQTRHWDGADAPNMFCYCGSKIGESGCEHELSVVEVGERAEMVVCVE